MENGRPLLCSQMSWLLSLTFSEAARSSSPRRSFSPNCFCPSGRNTQLDEDQLLLSLTAHTRLIFNVSLFTVHILSSLCGLIDLLCLLLLPWLLPCQGAAVKEFNAPLIIPLFKKMVIDHRQRLNKEWCGPLISRPTQESNKQPQWNNENTIRRKRVRGNKGTTRKVKGRE